MQIKTSVKSPHTCQNGCHQKKKKEYKCGEGYEKGNSPILLVRAATVENSMEACQKTKNKVTI